MNDESILDVMVCRNCLSCYKNSSDGKYYCEERKTDRKAISLDENCSFFSKRDIPINEEIPSENLDILKNPDLFKIITEKEVDKKIVGEFEARKTIFLVTCMRLVENLNKASDNLLINAFSGTGKDCVTEAIFGLIPEEEKEELIRISPKVLAYTRNRVFEPTATWKKVALRLEDVGNDVLNDNAFKVTLSADPNKINKSKIVNKGKIIDFEIEGKPSIIMTIADPNPSNEQLRRCPICYLDEGINQTKEILKRQAEYAKKGLSLEYDGKIISALRALKRIKVKIPFADKLLKIFNPQEVIVRTHFPRFLDYIKTSCALYQYQREIDNEGYYIATPEDYDVARIALIKTTSNILMIPLTKLKKDILDVFEEDDLQNKSVDDLNELKPIEKLNITPEWLRKQVDYLASKGFLNKGKEKRYDEAGKIIPKPIYTYSYNKMQKLEVPEWKDIDKMTSDTMNCENTMITSINSNTTQVNELNELFEVKNHLRTFEQNTEKRGIEIQRIE